MKLTANIQSRLVTEAINTNLTFLTFFPENTETVPVIPDIHCKTNNENPY